MHDTINMEITQFIDKNLVVEGGERKKNLTINLISKRHFAPQKNKLCNSVISLYKIYLTSGHLIDIIYRIPL